MAEAEIAQSVRIEFDLGLHGWATIQILAGPLSYEAGTFSYLTDALGDLVRAALAITTGAYRARFSLSGEPMEWRWLIERRNNDPDKLELRILSFADAFADEPDDRGRHEFSASCGADEFARAVSGAAEAVLGLHGLEGYHERWMEYPFPLRALRALQTALATKEAELPRSPLVFATATVLGGDGPANDR